MRIRGGVSFFILFLFFLNIFPSNGIAQTVEKKIDVILIVDGSGSMEWPDRDPGRLRIQGGRLFIDLCTKGDRVGLVDFSTDAKIVFPLYEFLTSLDKETLKEKIEKIAAKGEFTDITLGLEMALKEMVRARPESAKAVILLTDGEMDPDPSRDSFAPHNLEYSKEIRQAGKNKETIASIKEKYKKIVAPINTEKLKTTILLEFKEQKIPVFAIAFGPGADIPLLKEIADATSTEMGIRNFYFIESANRIQPVFSEIIEQLKKTKEKISEQAVTLAGDEIIHKVHIDDFVREVNFKFIFGQKTEPSDVNIELREPTGDVISRNTVKEGVGHILEKGYELFNIFNPLPGTWEAKIIGKKDVKMDITISTWGRTDLKIVAENAKSEYYSGESIPILASLQIDGKRVTSRDYLNDLKISAKVENPKNKASQIDLFDDGKHEDENPGDGIYGNSYADTFDAGDYFIKILAQGVTAGTKKYSFFRETDYKVRILPKEAPTSASVAKPLEEKEKGKWAPSIKTILLIVGIIILIFIAVLLIRKRKEGLAGDEEMMGFSTLSEPEALPTLTLKIKDGATTTVGSKIIKHPSIGERNMIVQRSGEKFYIQRGEGSLELNNKVVTEERELKDQDALKIGELYFEVNLNLGEDKVSLFGISKEQALLKTREGI